MKKKNNSFFHIISTNINLLSDLYYLFTAQILSIISLNIPFQYSKFYLLGLFTIGYLFFLLKIDKIQIIPFQMTHSLFLTLFTIPELILIIRNYNTLQINNNILLIFSFFFITFIFGFLLSNNKQISYLGTLERGIGTQFFINLVINLIVLINLYNSFGLKIILSIFWISGVLEVFKIEQQRQQHKEIHNWKQTYTLEMGGRYVGSLSNPIHTSAYLTVLLPSLLFLISNNTYSLILYIGLFILFSYGIFHTQGRASTITYLLETMQMVFYSASLIDKLNGFYILLYGVIPLIFAILYVNKFARDNIIRFKQLIYKPKEKTKDNETLFHIYEKLNRIVLWKEGLYIILNYLPFKGYGLANIQNAYNKYGRHKFKLFYNDKTNDSSHNILIDFGIQFGFFSLLLLSILLFTIGYNLLVTGNMIFFITYIVFIIEFTFSFPLQQNYFLIFSFLTLQFMNNPATLIFNIKYLGMILLPIVIMNLVFFIKENKMSKYLQMQTSLSKEGNKYAITLFQDQINEFILDQRPWLYQKMIYFTKIIRNNKVTLDDLLTFLNMFEDNKEQIIKRQENRAQVLYFPQNQQINIVLTLQNNKQIDITEFKKMQRFYVLEQLKYDPYSIDLRNLYKVILQMDGKIKEHNMLDDKIQLDIVNLYDQRYNMNLMIKDYIKRRDGSKTCQIVKKIQKERWNLDV